MDASDRIHRAWKKSGLTQRAFAAELGVSYRTLQSWIRTANDKSRRTPAPIYVREAERIAESMEITGPS